MLANPPWLVGVDIRGLLNSPGGEHKVSLVLGCSQESSESAQSHTSLWFSCKKDMSNWEPLRITNCRGLKVLLQLEKLQNQPDYLFSRLPFPMSLNPLAKGLLSIFSFVICRRKTILEVRLCRKTSVKKSNIRLYRGKRAFIPYHSDRQWQQWTLSLEKHKSGMCWMEASLCHWLSQCEIWAGICALNLELSAGKT